MGTQTGWPQLTGLDHGPAVPVTGPRRWWAGPLDVEGLVVASVRACAAAATVLAAARGTPVALSVDSRDVAAAVDSFRHLRVDGRATVGFAPLSRFFQTADGWVRTHANYPHHRDALLAVLGVPAGTEEHDLPRQVADAAAGMPAHTLETLVRARGGVAVAVRSRQEWLVHEHGRLVAGEPLVVESGTSAAGRDGRRPLGEGHGLPMAGLRVLDLTRVIAGPTATRVLGALGADVLRVDPPNNPELLDQHLDTGFAKRSTVADLDEPTTQERVEELLEAADVVISGYRPGALARLGLDAAALRERHPHLVVVELSAWGSTGAWGLERGFDSIVQAATGIADRYGADEPDGVAGRRPGALPVQALDHAAGYLAAATAMRLLSGRPDHGGASAALSLARIAHELWELPVTEEAVHPDPMTVRTLTLPSAYGPIEHVPPPLVVDGEPLAFPTSPEHYGSAALTWR